MRRLSQLAYILAALEFVREDQLGGAVFAMILLAWVIVIDTLEARSNWTRPSTPTAAWSTGVSSESAELQSGLWKLSFLASFFSLGLALFAPLLLVWSLIL